MLTSDSKTIQLATGLDKILKPTAPRPPRSPPVVSRANHSSSVDYHDQFNSRRRLDNTSSPPPRRPHYRHPESPHRRSYDERTTALPSFASLSSRSPRIERNSPQPFPTPTTLADTNSHRYYNSAPPMADSVQERDHRENSFDRGRSSVMALNHLIGDEAERRADQRHAHSQPPYTHPYSSGPSSSYAQSTNYHPRYTNDRDPPHLSRGDNVSRGNYSWDQPRPLSRIHPSAPEEHHYTDHGPPNHSSKPNSGSRHDFAHPHASSPPMSAVSSYGVDRPGPRGEYRSEYRPMDTYPPKPSFRDHVRDDVREQEFASSSRRHDRRPFDYPRDDPHPYLPQPVPSSSLSTALLDLPTIKLNPSSARKSPPPVYRSTYPHGSIDRGSPLPYYHHSHSSNRNTTAPVLRSRSSSPILALSAPGRPTSLIAVARRHSVQDELSRRDAYSNRYGPYSPTPSSHFTSYSNSSHHNQHPNSNHYHHPIPNLKAKRKRASPEQLAALNEVFFKTIFPSTDLRNQLAQQLAMTPRAVQIWFQNKRQTWRTKQRKEGKLVDGEGGSRTDPALRRKGRADADATRDETPEAQKQESISADEGQEDHGRRASPPLPQSSSSSHASYMSSRGESPRSSSFTHD